MRTALHADYADFMARIELCTTQQQMTEAANKEVRSEETERALRKIYVPVAKHFGQQTYEAVSKLKPKKAKPENIEEDYWLTWVDKIIKGSFGKRITWITGTTKDEFIRIVDKIAGYGFQNGIGVPEIAKQIRYELNISERYRSERIARTEVISASNMSSQAGALATGVPLDKTWIAKIDDKTRESHIAVDGEVVDINELFSNGLLLPGDPNGEAEDTINCRCAVGYLSKSDSDYSWGRDF